MGCEVYANGDEIACKAGDNKVIAAMPDVCLSPPSPPAGPVPVPYPNTSFSKDLQNGSKTVMIKGQEAMLKDQSFHKTSPLGDEAATNGLGAGVVTHVITGKTYCVAWSMDVKFEGQNVDRHSDLTTSNHASPIPNRGAPQAQFAAKAAGEIKECPCCQGPLHDNQKDESGQSLPTQSEEQYYQSQTAYIDNKRAGRDAWFKDNPGKEKQLITVKVCGESREVERAVDMETQMAMMQVRIDELKSLRDANPDCRNVHNPKDEKCGTHFVVPRKKRKKKLQDGTEVMETPGQSARRQTNPTVEKAVRADAAAKYPGADTGGDIAHKTPMDAGGCPVKPDNMIPQNTIEGEDCKKIEELQTCIQGASR
jgi:hypothetical protein